MLIDTTDVRSNAPEQIEHAFKVIGRSKDCFKVFKAIYRGKKMVKTQAELQQLTGLSKIRVLQEGGKLYTNRIIEQIKTGKPAQIAYKKVRFYSGYNYRKIINLVKNPKKAEKLVTKRNPFAKSIKINISGRLPKYKQITVDDIDNFKKIKEIFESSIPVKKLKEEYIKRLFKKIAGERGNFKDWGGECSDLFSLNFRIKGERIATAIAFKGRGTSGILTPEKMGKRGTQIERLFQEPAQLFLIVYHSQIDSRTISQMQAFALAKAMREQKIYYGVIDGNDLSRIVEAYKEI